MRGVFAKRPPYFKASGATPPQPYPYKCGGSPPQPYVKKTDDVPVGGAPLKCALDQTRRKGYTTKAGVKVRPVCIKSTAAPGAELRLAELRETLARQRQAERAMANVSPTRCPEGMIRRSAYVRAAYTRADGTRVQKAIVAADCIKEQGKRDARVGLYSPTGERVYVPINSAILGVHGYHDIKHKTAAQRHAALDKILRATDKNWLSLFRTLNYLAVVNKSHPTLHALLIADRNYVGRQRPKE